MMNDKELAQMIFADKDFDKTAYEYIKAQLDEETAKPKRKRDYDKIERLTVELGEICGDDELDCSESIDKLYKKIAETQKHRVKSASAVRRFVPAICCAVAIVVANCVTAYAWDMNIVSAIIKFTKGGFSVDFDNQQEVVSLPTSEDDPYGIIAECAKYEIYPETPHYIPDGFELTAIDSNVNEDFANTVSFTFESGKKIISFDFRRYWNEVGNIGIPSDKYNISETTVNGKPAVVSKEDNQYTITFVNGKTMFFMFTQDVPYDECEKIVNSIR